MVGGAIAVCRRRSVGIAAGVRVFARRSREHECSRRSPALPAELLYVPRLDGAGSPRVYPPLAGHVPSLLAAHGREYLVRVPLSGLSGPIVIGSDRFDGIMAPFAFRTDAELAAILSYIASAWGNDRLLPPCYVAFTSTEVASVRAEGGFGADVRAMRPLAVHARKGSRD